MTAKDSLHRWVDELTDDEAERFLRTVEAGDDPVLKAMLAAARLDPEVASEDDLKAIEEAYESVAEEGLIPHEEVKRRWLGER